MKIWNDFSKNSKSLENENNNQNISPMVLSPKWAIESGLLEIYLLLIHRIKGIGLSLKEFWDMDTWTTSLLYLRELDLIDYEDETLNGSSEESDDDPNMVDLVDDMYGVES